MINKKLISLLQTFSPEEFQRFGDYLRSPYFNKNKKLVTFYNEIKDFHPLFTDIRLTKENIYKKVLCKEAYNDSTMRNWFVNMKAMAEKFLSSESSLKQNTSPTGGLLAEFSERNLDKHFMQKADKEGKSLEERKTKVDFRLFQDLYMHEISVFNFKRNNLKIYGPKEIESLASHLKKASIYLFNYFITEIHSFYCNMSVLQSDYKVKNDPDLISKVIKLINLREVKESIAGENEYNFVLDIYCALFNSHEGADKDESYKAYKKVLFRNADKLSSDEVTFHFSKLITFCIKKVRAEQSNEKYSKELFSLYRTSLEKEYYKNKKVKHLPYDLYRNIIVHGVRLKKYKWTREFIEKYSSKVLPDDAANMRNFGLANYYYMTGKYNEAFNYLNEFKDENFIYMVDMRVLFLKTYFELGNSESALCILESLRISLLKSPIVSENRAKRYRSFLYYAGKLFLAKAGDEKVDIGFQKMKLKGKDNVLYKSWLLEKMDELISGAKKTG